MHILVMYSEICNLLIESHCVKWFAFFDIDWGIPLCPFSQMPSSGECFTLFVLEAWFWGLIFLLLLVLQVGCYFIAILVCRRITFQRMAGNEKRKRSPWDENLASFGSLSRPRTDTLLYVLKSFTSTVAAMIYGVWHLDLSGLQITASRKGKRLCGVKTSLNGVFSSNEPMHVRAILQSLCLLTLLCH